MKIVVDCKVEAIIEFDNWVRRLPGTAVDVERLLDVYLTDFRQRLEGFSGLLPEAIEFGNQDPPVYRYPFVLGLEIIYSVEVIPRSFWRKARKITILQFRIAHERVRGRER